MPLPYAGDKSPAYRPNGCAIRPSEYRIKTQRAFRRPECPLCFSHGVLIYLTPVVVAAGDVIGVIVDRRGIGVSVGRPIVAAAAIELGSARIEALRQAGSFLLADRCDGDGSGQVEVDKGFGGNPDPRTAAGCRACDARACACRRAMPAPTPRSAMPPMIAPSTAPPKALPAVCPALFGPFTLNWSVSIG